MWEEKYIILKNYLAAQNLKLTPQRKLILDMFLQEKGHLTSEELYDKIKKQAPSIGQATVYRTLKLFSEAELAREVHFGDGVTRYEINHSDAHHDHILCDICGKTLEVVDDEIERLQEQLAKAHGFSLTRHKMYLYGICAGCQKKAGRPDS